jgi:hypothetical protein
MIGPFADKTKIHPPEQKIDFKASYPGAEGDVAWKTVESPGPIIPCYKRFSTKKKRNDLTAYAAVFAYCEEPVKAEIEVWYWSGVKVWVNSSVVLENSESSKWDVLFSRAPVTFRKGRNPILIKIGKQPWNWTLQMRLAAPEAVLKKIILKTERNNGQ